jgi:hypothetical protein
MTSFFAYIRNSQGGQKIGKTTPKFWKKKPKELPKPINGTIIYITPF